MTADIAQAQEMVKMARVQAFRYCGPGEGLKAVLLRDKGQKTGQIQPYPSCFPTPHLPILPPHHPPTLPAPPSLHQE
jgi:hypothetical protein